MTTTDKLRALRESLSIETWIGPEAGVSGRSPTSRRSTSTLTLRLRGVTDRWSAAHVLAAAVAPVVGPAGAARAHVDSNGDVLIETSSIPNAQVARMHVERLDLVGQVSAALLAIGVVS